MPRAEFGDSIHRAYIYATSLYGLVLMLVGTGIILRHLFAQAYDALSSTQVLLPGEGALWNGATQTALAIFLVGGAYWYWHWHRVARDDINSVLRQVYLHLFAILGGAATVLVTLNTLLFRALQLAFGEPGTADQFQFLPGALAALIIGGGLWCYHRAGAQQGAAKGLAGLPAAPRGYG